MVASRSTSKRASPLKLTRSVSAAQAEAVVQSKPARAPQRCRRCPNAPLRAKCEHSAKGRALAAENEAAAAVDNVHGLASASTLPPSDPFIFSSTISQTGVPFTEVPVIPVTTQTLSPTALRSQSPAAMTTLLPPPLPLTPIRFLPPTSSPGPEIDPLLTTPECGGGVSPAIATSVATSTPETYPPIIDINQLSPSPTSSRLERKYTRTRATAMRPLFGHVKGVYRGNDPHTIVRRKQRPAPINDSKLASKSFLENVNALVEKCEDISIKTGAWLFFGVQHPVAIGAAITYASPRLKRDGGADANDLGTSFLSLVNDLMAAKRTDTRQLQKSLEDQRLTNDVLASQLRAAQEKAAEQERTLQEFRDKLTAATLHSRQATR